MLRIRSIFWYQTNPFETGFIKFESIKPKSNKIFRWKIEYNEQKLKSQTENLPMQMDKKSKTEQILPLKVSLKKMVVSFEFHFLEVFESYVEIKLN